MVLQTQAAVRLYDETFSTNPDDPDIAIWFRIIVWSNQHIEIEVSYMYRDIREDMCTFFWIAVGTRYTSNKNTDIPHYAPYVLKEGYVDVYGNLDQQMWEAGQRMLFIDVEMYFDSFAHTDERYAIQRLVLVNVNNLFAVGWARTFYIDLVNYHIV